jgi:hypothetical protein
MCIRAANGDTVANEVPRESEAAVENKTRVLLLKQFFIFFYRTVFKD